MKEQKNGVPAVNGTENDNEVVLFEVKCVKTHLINVEARNADEARSIAERYCEECLDNGDESAVIDGKPAKIFSPYKPEVYSADGVRDVAADDIPDCDDDDELEQICWP